MMKSKRYLKNKCENVHLYPSNFSNESRILKITEDIEALDVFSNIVMIGTGKGEWEESSNRKVMLLGGENKLNSGLLRKLFTFLSWYLSVIRFCFRREISCVNAHSLSSLMLALIVARISRGATQVVYDTHELETETIMMRGIRQKVARIIERLLICNVDIVFVVSESIKVWYERNTSAKRIEVICNCPRFRVVEKEDLFRSRLGIRENQKIYLYQGDFSLGRGIEVLLEVFKSRSNVESEALVLMGGGTLEQLVGSYSDNTENIYSVPFVPTNEVLRYTSSADFGLNIIQPVCLSYAYSLPNKFFEYAMAGLPTISSDLVEVKRLISDYQNGLLVKVDKELFEEINFAIDRIAGEDYSKMSENSQRLASELSWDNQVEVIKEYYSFFKGD